MFCGFQSIAGSRCMRSQNNITVYHILKIVRCLSTKRYIDLDANSFGANDLSYYCIIIMMLLITTALLVS